MRIHAQGTWTNLSSGCYSDVDLGESLPRKSYHDFFHNFHPKAIVNVSHIIQKLSFLEFGLICWKLVRSGWKTGQIYGKLVRFVENCSYLWKTGQICGKLVRFVGNWADLSKTGQSVELAEVLKKLSRMCSKMESLSYPTAGHLHSLSCCKVAKLSRLCTKIATGKMGNRRTWD